MGDEKSAKKYLLKYFNASVVTQLPDIPGSSVKGIVKVKRTSTTVEEARELTWTTHENLTNMINENNTEAQNYYAIDDNWNICVSTANTMQSGEEVTNTLRQVSIPYQRLIGKYSMPFRFLFIMLQVTQNPEYVNYLCDMSSKGKQIDLMVFDSVQTSQDTITYRYKEITKRLVEKLDENGMVQYTPFGEVMMEEIQEEEEKEETTVYTTKSNTITANVTYANTWLIEQRNEYINSQTTEYPLGEDGQEEEGEDDEEPEEEEAEWRVDQSTITKTEITKNSWKESESEENNGTIKENEFLGLWKNETGKPELGAKYDPKGKLVYYKSLNGKQKRSPIQEILNNKLFLFELLEQYEETQNYSTIMRYMLYKYTGKNYGVTKLNLDIFKQDDFYAINSSGSGADIGLFESMLTREEFIQALKDYAATSGNQHFITNFLPRAGEIYDLGEKYHVNPELIITMALKESGFKSRDGNQNFWGLDTPNGSSLAYIGSFEKGVEKLADRYNVYADPSSSHYRAIEEEAAKRQAAGCNPNGYGPPTSLKGFLSRYSDLIGTYNNGNHIYGNWSDGGTIYLEEIYGDEFDAKCGYHSNGRIGPGGHTGSTKFTIQEKADYTAYMYEKQLQYWETIFGKYATLGGETSAGDTGNAGYSSVYKNKIGTFKLFKQARGHYSSQKYIATNSVATIAQNGCCPTSLAIVATGYGIDTDPGKVAELMGGTRSTQNSSASNAARVLRGMGLNATGHGNVNKQEIRNHLLTGNAMMISIYGGNPHGSMFSSAHHWLTVLDFNPNTEEVYVGNSSSTASGWLPLDYVVSAASNKWWVSVSR